MQLELPFGAVATPASAPVKRTDESKPQARSAAVLVFPSARNHAQVSSLARRLAPLSAMERELVWAKHSRGMLKCRQLEGLSRAQARADVTQFRDAVRKLVAYLEAEATQPSGRAVGDSQ